MKPLRLISLMLIGLFILTACSAEPPATDTVEAIADDEAMSADTSAASDGEMMDGESMSQDTADESMDHEEMDPPEMGMDEAEAAGEDAMKDGGDNMAVMPGELPDWQLLPLTDVRDGATFTLADFAGKTVFVEPMATWCTNCRMQLFNVQQARAELSESDFLFVGLSVETNLNQASLAQYTQGFGFDWAFAVASPELLQALVDEFGRAIVNPPSTPHFIIRPDGSFGELVTGIESAEQLISRLQG
jgi:thiol-disulfide isomerase/thioredoxin